MLIDGTGLHWMDCRFAKVVTGRPALFLDRDGVIVEEVNYLSKLSDVRLTPGIGPAIAAVNRAGISVNVVTNQSGVGRGMFGWDAFVAVEAEIAAQLARHAATLDSVLACGAEPAADDPWRKPQPGMIGKVRELIEPDLSRSFIVGDRVSDLEAGRRGGLAGCWLVETGYGRDVAASEILAMTSHSGSFVLRKAANAAIAIGEFLAIVEAN